MAVDHVVYEQLRLNNQTDATYVRISEVRPGVVGVAAEAAAGVGEPMSRSRRAGKMEPHARRGGRAAGGSQGRSSPAATSSELGRSATKAYEHLAMISKPPSHPPTPTPRRRRRGRGIPPHLPKPDIRVDVTRHTRLRETF
ncbi:hypothetical protein C0Q70_12935 [Pomacea canaliculata]|uniref:Uncharacterized protein n=1 Tax=Pomacea canaliculata TaxID=400727 RepID=A0A2T7P303_POMCA|nr:hypothetical protein C0Q70_12935 [Pomacea canaliculata]